MMKKRSLVLMLSVLTYFYTGSAATQSTYDICVYDTSTDVIAAYSAAKMHKNVIPMEPSKNLGGLTSGILGFADIGNKAVVIRLAETVNENVMFGFSERLPLIFVYAYQTHKFFIR
jgi:hypothetical protein